MIDITAEQVDGKAAPAGSRKSRSKAGAPMAPASVLPAERVKGPANVPKVVRRGRRDALLYVLLTALVLGAWGITRLRLYETKSDFAYWLGIVGGVCMLLLLTYPLRKHWRFMARFGAGSRWFMGHMVLGIAGPILILLHSNFEIGSLNAGVALFSMLTVAGSGVMGRFLYVRLHRNLNGVRITLDQLRAMLDVENAAAARLRFAPAVMERLYAFEQWAQAHPSVTATAVLRNLVTVPWKRWRAELECRLELRRRLVVVAHSEGWSRRKFNARLEAARKLTHDYLGAVQRAAQFSVWERLFSWWHVAHVPIVYMLVISAIAHIVAVHVY